MDYKVKRAGLTLYTKDKYLEEDISILPDESLIPAGTIEITENGEIDVTNYEKANVNVASGGNDEALMSLYNGDLVEAIIPEGVTTIREKFFYKSPNLRKVTFSSTVKGIQGEAFRECASLENIIIPDTVTSVSNGQIFADCKNLKSAILSKNAPKIGSYMFSRCSNLINVEIPEGVDELYYDAITYCPLLINLTLPSTITKLGSNALPIGSSTNKASIRFEGAKPPTISANTFNASYLEKIEVPSQFINAYKTETNWANFADYIVGYDKDYDKSISVAQIKLDLTDTLPTSTPKLHFYGFKGDILIDWGDETISVYSAKDTIKQYYVTKPSKYSTQGVYNITMTLYGYESGVPCSVYFDNGSYSQYVSEIELSNCFSEISMYLVNNSSKITNVIIPNTVTALGYGAFRNCTNLTYLEIPSSITDIGSYTLQIGATDSKATIKFLGTTPPTIATNTFTTIKLEKIEVPMSALDAYKSATNWASFADYIIGYEEE